MNRVATYEDPPSERLAIGLGWFSVALGIAELAAPRSVARLIGVTPDSSTDSVLRSIGARKVGNGLAILAQPDKAMWLWGRVAGDTLDLATLAGAMSAPDTQRGRAAFATIAVLGVTALDVLCAQQLSMQQRQQQYGDGDYLVSDRRAAKPPSIDQVVTINASVDTVSEFWRGRNRLPESLQTFRSSASSSQDSEDQTGGSVEFRAAAGGRGTEVRVRLAAQSSGGVGNTLASLVGRDPAGRIKDDLRKVKQMIEIGEVTLSDGPSLWRPAQPASDPQEKYGSVSQPQEYER